METTSRGTADGDRGTGPGPAGLPPRALAWLRKRDPGLAATRRAGRGAIVMPGLFALCSQVIGSREMASFAAFGAFAMLLLVDFDGPVPRRLRAMAALAVTWAVLICWGTAVSRVTWLGVASMAVVGFAALFCGIVSSTLAGATTALLLGFILPVSLRAPLSALPDRLSGAGLAAGASMLAAALLWPRPATDPLTGPAVAVCRAVAARLRVDAALVLGPEPPDDARCAQATTDVTEAENRLRRAFDSTPYRPTGLSTGGRALVRLVDELTWLTAIVAHGGTPQDATRGRAAAPCRVRLAAADTLERAVDLLTSRTADPTPLRTAADRLRAALETLERDATSRLPGRQRDGDPGRPGGSAGGDGRERAAADGEQQAAEPDAAGGAGREGAAPGARGRHAFGPDATADGPATRGPGERPAAGEPGAGSCGGRAGFGSGGAEGGPTGAGSGAGGADVAAFLGALDASFRAQELSFAVLQIAANVELAAAAERRGWADRLLGRAPRGLPSAPEAARERAAAHFSAHSVWLHNSVRGAAGLALAVAITDVASVQHAFWVVLGALSVLRSNALNTGQNAVRGLAGTVAGSVIGAGLLQLIGHDGVRLWYLLPVAVLLAGVAPAVISFAAGQAAFTVTLVILFNIGQVPSWRVGLFRVEDIAIGCAVSLVVGVLFWPRGAAAEVDKTMATAYRDSADYLADAVDYAVGCCSAGPEPAAAPLAAGRQAAAAARRLDDAFRGYLAERGPKPLPLAEMTALVTGVVGLRLAADAVLGLWQRAGDPHTEAERAAARAELLSAADGVSAWYHGLAAGIRGGEPVPEPQPDDPAADARLAAAVRRDLRDDQGRATATAVRIVWTGDHLAAARRLQSSLAVAATRTRSRPRTLA
ncbi:FUSC family protein [Streptomyces sp. NRRL F-5123]|uniref:FUSC family protein n=1 Tax=Streptomyces sp. NRRL F-5123 TaxID=1463856 RepID=UPI0007C54AF2|nr:FUSC family protein [Streptomyces sp. NRRL F-5123]